MNVKLLVIGIVALVLVVVGWRLSKEISGFHDSVVTLSESVGIPESYAVQALANRTRIKMQDMHLEAKYPDFSEAPASARYATAISELYRLDQGSSETTKAHSPSSWES